MNKDEVIEPTTVDEVVEPTTADQVADAQGDSENADNQTLTKEETSSAEAINSDEPSLEQQLADAQQEAAKNLDLALRAKAELENARRRNVINVEEAHKFGIRNFARELLNVADSIELGLKASTEETATVKVLREGMAQTQKQLLDVFSNLNIEIIDAMGAKFNPDLHEAMTLVPNSEMEPNTVMDVVQKGYTLNDRLLRASKVIVTKAK